MRHRLLTFIPALCVVGLVSLATPVEAKNPLRKATPQAATKEATRQAAVKAKLSKEKDAIAVFARGLC